MFSSLPAPKGIENQMRSIQRDFLWGRGEEKKKWALVAWDKMCKPKSMVAWGFMTLKPSTEFQEPKFGGGVSRSRNFLGLSFGKKNMPSIVRRRIILES